jgi:hypothetical protein
MTQIATGRPDSESDLPAESFRSSDGTGGPGTIIQVDLNFELATGSEWPGPGAAPGTVQAPVTVPGKAPGRRGHSGAWAGQDPGQGSGCQWSRQRLRAAAAAGRRAAGPRPISKLWRPSLNFF